MGFYFKGGGELLAGLTCLTKGNTGCCTENHTRGGGGSAGRQGKRLCSKTGQKLHSLAPAAGRRAGGDEETQSPDVH